MAAHAGAGLAVLALPVPFGLKWLTVVVLAVAGYRVWRVLALAPDVAAVLDDQGRWQINSMPIRYRVVRAARDPFAVRLLLEEANGQRRRLLIMRDAVDVMTFHALCSRIVQKRLPVPDIPV